MCILQVTHGGDNFRRTAPCPLCFSQIAARELRVFTSRQIKPVQVHFLTLQPPHMHNSSHCLLSLPARVNQDAGDIINIF